MKLQEGSIMQRKADIICLAVICLAFIIIIPGCKEGSTPREPVCGDNMCEPSELNVCSQDCSLNDEMPEQTDPKVTPGDVVNDLRNRRNLTPGQESQTTKPSEGQHAISDPALIAQSVETMLPETGFQVISRHNMLNLNENISGIMGVLTGAHMREVLGGGYLRGNTEAFGPRAAFYEQFLTLRSGQVLFGLEEETDIVTDYLEFQEGEPIFDYMMRLNGGIFKFFEGQAINFLGHQYNITDVTNNTMTFMGLTTPDTIIFRKDHSAIVNGKTLSGRMLNATIEKDYLRIMINAPDDIRLLPGELLTERLTNRAILLTNRIDLAYNGLTDAPIVENKITQGNSQYKLSFVNSINMSYDLTICRISPLKMGGKDYSLVYKEGKGSSDYNINRNDKFIITNNREYGGITNIIRLLDIDYEAKLIELEDTALEKFYVHYSGTEGKNAAADLLVYQVNHKIFVGPNGSQTISVDLNGDGSINGGKASIIAAGNSIFRINSNSSQEINMSFITPGQMRENSKANQETRIMITSEGIAVDESSLIMQPIPGAEAMVGMTDYGTAFIIKDSIQENDQSGDDLIIRQPLYARFADVVVKAYE